MTHPPVRHGAPCWFALAAAGALLAGCTPAQYAEKADRAAYKVVDQKQKLSLGAEKAFNIEYNPFATSAAENRPMLDDKPIPLGDQPARVLTLPECLEIAFSNSRDFQNRREQLYIEALNLANERHDWSGFGGAVDGEIASGVTSGGPTESSAEAGVDISFTQRLAQGGTITLGAGLTMATDLLGLSSTDFGSELQAKLVQPLWQGAWRGFAYEDLFRSERDMAISVLAFERFTQTFSTDITTDYYGVLRRLDQLANEEANIQRLELALRRTQVQVDEGGDVSRTQQDQTEKSLLDARVRLTDLRERSQNELDEFKITLGLPVSASVELDPDELVRLGARKPEPIPFVDDEMMERLAEQAAVEAAAAYDVANPDADGDPVTRRVRDAVLQRRRAEAYERIRDAMVTEATEKATDIALHTRPDVLTEMAKVRDVCRDVEIAADKFNPSVDLELSASVESEAPRKPLRMGWGGSTRRAQVVVNYPLDQTENRSNYRKALITEAQTLRDYDMFLDNVRLDIRDAYRGLVKTRQTYDLEVKNVEVAERRQKLAALEQADGRAEARDVLEAEEGLRNAQNGLTASLVTYETTRIHFLATLGMLDVDERGQYRERETPFLFAKLGERYGNVEDIGNEK